MQRTRLDDALDYFVDRVPILGSLVLALIIVLFGAAWCAAKASPNPPSLSQDDCEPYATLAMSVNTAMSEFTDYQMFKAFAAEVIRQDVGEDKLANIMFILHVVLSHKEWTPAEAYKNTMRICGG